MARNRLARAEVCFVGQEKQLGKKISFFSKEQDLKNWLRENPHRHQITQVRARKILGDDFLMLVKTRLDKDIVEFDSEYQSLLESRQVRLKKGIYNPYRDYDVNYKPSVMFF